jgi:hypothetical protein
VTVLTATAFALALQCGNGVDPDLLAGFATVESGGNPLAIHQNVRGTSGRSFAPRTIDEAVQIATALIASGASIDSGTFQINNRNLDLLQISLSETFDTCRAASAAARLLALMSRYNSGSPTASLPYARTVTASVRAIKGGASPIVTAIPLTKAPEPPSHISIFLAPHPARELVFTSPQ